MLLWLIQPSIWLTLTTLIFLEIILGVDNIIFLSSAVAKLPLSQQDITRRLGLSCVMIVRILLLIPIAWLSRITQPLLAILMLEISSRILILSEDRLFLIYKAVQEVREELSPAQENEHNNGSRQLSLCGAIIQIILSDIVFSLDSAITVTNLSQHIPIVIVIMMIAAGVIILAAKTIGGFVSATPLIKILVLTFLLSVGVSSVADNLNIHIVKEYPYFTIFFSLSVETPNITRERKNKRVSTLLEVHGSHSH